MLNNILKKKNIILYSPSFKNNNEKIFKQINSQSIMCIPIYTENPNFFLIKKILITIEKISFDYLIAIGGGKTIDTAKILKYLLVIKNIKKKLFVIPTLYGSGTEVTSSAVYYVNEKKYSVESKYIKPNKIINILKLSRWTPKILVDISAMDCLCQSIESIWSLKANNRSIKLAEKSLKLSYNFLRTKKTNLNKSQQQNIILASKLVGQAMNITRTTAPHALSYSLTSFQNIPHGQAVCLIMKVLLKNNLHKIKKEKKIKIFFKIFKVKSINAFNSKFLNLVNSLNLNLKLNLSKKDIQKYIAQINIERLANNPLSLTKKEIINIYNRL